MIDVDSIKPGQMSVKNGVFDVPLLYRVPSAVVKFFSPSCPACRDVRAPYARIASKYGSPTLLYLECDLSLANAESLVADSMTTDTPLYGVPEFVLFHYGRSVRSLDREFVLNVAPDRFFPANTHVEVELRVHDWNDDDDSTSGRVTRNTPNYIDDTYRTLGSY
ncbi:18.3 kDa [Spodoptera frugiperda ascovirus 1a]|uniref:18.3 kDa n=1 Tax=Spodoptera frugiperda ascovirus 1a TaxID=113370 RepID=Q0E4Y5_SFAVA|nr:18.3 kDa [Spodoptera frugiperda ascovirus 1a]CAL44716.1 18.3 kDa [Spodoptera frugiperda ascovirus 1a]